MAFESCQLTPFRLENSSVRKWIFLCSSSVFSANLSWSEVKCARITSIHVCFIALTLAASLGRCLNTPPICLVFKKLSRIPANTMCDPYII